ncbi:unnamed protein product, partial [Vitis vinifera]
MKLPCYMEYINIVKTTKNAAEQLIKINQLLAELTRSHHNSASVQLFVQIHSSNYLKPDHFTLSSTLTACANLRYAASGNQLHAYSIQTGLKAYTHVGNTLLSFYAKSKDLVSVQRVFNEIENPDVYSWTTLLSASDHLSCIVDLLGRAGYLEEAERLINSKHLKIVSSIWWTLFSACAAHGNLRLGRIVAGFLLEIEQNDPAVYVLLSNIYAAAGQWEEAANTRDLMQKTRVAKQPGCSWIGS